jgi:hypothetical protein
MTHSLNETYQAIQQAEAGLTRRYQRNAVQAFIKSFNHSYTLQSLPDTVKRVYASLFYFRIQQKRALFNINPKLHAVLFNRYLPRRAFLYRHGTQSQQQQYEDTLAQLQQRFRFFEVSYTTTQCTKVPSADASSHYMFCGQVLELLYYRMDLVEVLLTQQPHGFHVQLCADFDQTYFDPGYIQINPLVLWMDGASDRSPGVVHVCLHLLSQLHNQGVQSDTLPGMSWDDETVMATTRQQLEQLAVKTDLTRRGQFYVWLTGQPQTGVHPYAFYPTMAEFLTTTVEQAMKAPQQLAKTPAGHRLLAFYHRYFQWPEIG